MTLAPGTKLGPYEILAPIGAGGMGEVYRARDPRVGRDVAIKVSSEQFSDRFSREIHAVAALNHSNVCTLFDVGPNYLVMELVEGPTLADRIKQGAIPLEESLEIARQIADALEAAHEKGIVHRDLKPGNIKIKPDGTVKVLDFGLAKVEDTAAVSLETSPTLSVAQTAAGVLLGTAAYMSPEQARGRPVDKRADIWAFGVVLYEMLTGKQLFSGETVSDTLASALKEEPDFEKVPAKVRLLLRSCLEKNPPRRLRDIGDAWRLLESAPQPDTTKGPRILRIWAAVTTMLTIALATAVILLVRNQAAPEDDWRMHSQLDVPEMLPFAIPSISPDGRNIVFVGRSEGKSMLFVRPLDALESRPLRGTEDALYPFWSSDSRFIGFGAGGKLKKVSVSGGYPEPLCDLPSTLLFRGGTWNSQDVLLFAGSNSPLHRIPASGGTPVAVTAIDQNRQETSHTFPCFLPDGKHFLFSVRSMRPENQGIYIGSLNSGVQKRVVSGFGSASFANSGWLLFPRDGNLLAQHFDQDRLEVEGDPLTIVRQVVLSPTLGIAGFSVSKTNLLVYRRGLEFYSSPLIWVDRSGKQIGSAIGASGEPALSPDGSRIAVIRVQREFGSTDIWLVDTSRGIDEPLTRHPAWDQHPFWSPDGKRIAFSSSREGRSRLFQMSINSGSRREEQLLDSTTTIRVTDWSRDGRFIIYRKDDASTNTDLWALPLFGDRKPFPIADSEFGEAQGKVSPDGRWIAYSSDESGRPEIYVQSFPSRGGRQIVSVNGGFDPRWRRNGEELFYIAADGKMMAVPVVKGEVPKFGTPVALFDVKIFSPVRESSFYDVSADGQRFVLQVPFAFSSQINIILNWTSLLKK